MNFSKLIKVILLTALLTGCGLFQKVDSNDFVPSERKAELLAAKEGYLKELTQFDWIGRDCDGLLWNSLACASGHKVDIFKAEYEPGRWHRRPPPACFDGKDQGAKSTISQDMLTGLFWCLWELKDARAVERLIAYGKKNAWVMGEPYPEMFARVVLSTNGRNILEDLNDELGGKSENLTDVPPIYLPAPKDFEKHLQSLTIALIEDMEGEYNDSSVTKQMIYRLKENLVFNKDDALFNAVLGLFQEKNLKIAINLILDPKYQLPSYVRGDVNYGVIHKLFTIHIILKGIK